jgi:hypothetical protein
VAEGNAEASRSPLLDSTAGCNVFVADRGAVKFDFPREWVIAPGDDSINLHDKAPPDDDCVLAVSYLRLPPIDWSGLPLAGGTPRHVRASCASIL